MTTEKELPWFPGYEFQEFIYQSFLVLPTPAEITADPGATVPPRNGLRVIFYKARLLNSGGEGKYTFGATLQFDSGPRLDISVKGDKGIGHSPGTFEAIGTGIEGPLKGAIYALYGWVFPEEAHY